MTFENTFLDDLRHEVDEAHNTTSGADAVPDELWLRVRSLAGSDNRKEVPDMNAGFALSSPISPPAPHRDTASISRFVNAAASVLLIAAIALGGWFASGRLNAPPQDDPRLAAIGATPTSEIAACDVEPLTTDEAFSIAKNPFSSFEPDYESLSVEAKSNFDSFRSMDELEPPWVSGTEMLLDAPLSVPTEEDISGAADVANAYLACASSGTVGQVWRLEDPILVQASIHELLPMFTSEEDAREFLDGYLQQPATQAVDVYFPENGSMQINSDLSLGLYTDQPSGMPVYTIDVYIAPMIFRDADGNTLLETQLSGFPIESNGLRIDDAANIILARSVIDGEWYVVGIVGPQVLEPGANNPEN